MERKQYVFLDGGHGHDASGGRAAAGRTAEQLAITRPELLTSIHAASIEAGSDIGMPATFGIGEKAGGNRPYGGRAEFLRALECARRAAEPAGALVALDVGPWANSWSLPGPLRFEDAYEYFAQIMRACGYQGGRDCIETMTDLYEVKLALLAARKTAVCR